MFFFIRILNNIKISVSPVSPFDEIDFTRFYKKINLSQSLAQAWLKPVSTCLKKVRLRSSDFKILINTQWSEGKNHLLTKGIG